MKKLLLIFLFYGFHFTMANDFIVTDYESEIPEDYIQLDHELNQYYQLVIRQLEPQYRNRFAQIQQKWVRYRSRHCANSSVCKINVTEIQTENLNSLLLGKIEIKQIDDLKIQFDVDGEITQYSYEKVRALMLTRYENVAVALTPSAQREYRRSYEIYNAYLYDYCELLNHLTPVNFLNCQIKGLIDFQYETNASAI